KKEVDKQREPVIIWRQRKNQHAEEKSRMWKVPERGADAGSALSRKHLKTTSEWPQSGPVTPLSSK
ncbi:MAG TPA: hypothetical protein H9753_15730, partial [Candidatus Blautia merdavium]|nr:hypothetical protein [Candidatus Blautia merdavium]